MFEYEFPTHITLDEVKKIIEDREEFYIADFDDYYIVNYHVNLTDTFPKVDSRASAIKRELRGLVFGKDGNVLERRYHKFFNLGEREETLLHHLPKTSNFSKMVKRDGSMITPIRTDKGYVWASKMGETDVTSQVRDYIKDNPKYDSFVKNFSTKLTPMFEWCSRKQRIVIDYPSDELVLTAMRNKETGYYTPWGRMKEYCRWSGIPVIEADHGDDFHPSNFIDEVKDLKGMEGYVLRYASGHMVKLKADEYCLMHNARDAITLEKNVIKLIATQTLDDILPKVAEDESVMLQRFADRFWQEVQYQVSELSNFLYEIRNDMRTKKEFALGMSRELNPIIRSMFYKCWDVPDHELDNAIRNEVITWITTHCATKTRVDSVRFLFGDLRWQHIMLPTDTE